MSLCMSWIAFYLTVSSSISFIRLFFLESPSVLDVPVDVCVRFFTLFLRIMNAIFSSRLTQSSTKVVIPAFPHAFCQSISLIESNTVLFVRFIAQIHLVFTESPHNVRIFMKRLETWSIKEEFPPQNCASKIINALFTRILLSTLSSFSSLVSSDRH